MDDHDLTLQVVAERIVSALSAGEETLAVAESLTGGLLAAAVVAVPGASAMFKGGIVAYATDAKEHLLAVDPAALAATGPVDPTVAVQMAMGARFRLDSTWALSTTGVAGPDPQPGDPAGAPAGTVYLGIAGPRIGQAVRLQLPGDRDEIRHEAARQALLLLGVALGVVETLPADASAGETSEAAGGAEPGETDETAAEEPVAPHDAGNNEGVPSVPLM